MFFTHQGTPSAQRLSPNQSAVFPPLSLQPMGLVVAIQSRIANGAEESWVRFGFHTRGNASDPSSKAAKTVT
jgi:hypothetical protein